jgi:phosphoenolpyruvate carboxykinase (ATP)
MDLSVHDVTDTGGVHRNLAPALLIEKSLQRQETLLASNGAIAAYTSPHTGRAAREKYAVRRPASQERVWWGSINQPVDADAFERVLEHVRSHYRGRELFVFDGWACADAAQRVAVRVIAEKAWHALFADRLFRHASAAELADFRPEVVMYHAPELRLDPARHGTQGDVGVILDYDTGRFAIVGTHYAGEIKKSVFSYLNYVLPERGVFPMHCSATVGPAGDTALLFGLSGTGKTTLSADPQRRLIGDDEHGWSDGGIFNFEGGCYAKCIRLSAVSEPQIYDALRFGSLLENVVLDEMTRRPDYDDTRITENTRAAYPLDHIANLEPTGLGTHPRHVLFLAADAFGVLPPLSRLSTAQAQYHFLSGYTARVAGTEAGVSQPEATFSSCFAAPFLPRPPVVYARLLQERLQRHGAQVWLVNTGWAGGPPGQGQRLPLAVTRRLVAAALEGALAAAEFVRDPVFGLDVPAACAGVPSELLQPRRAWSSVEAYDAQTRRLAQLFHDNFQQYASQADEAVRRAGPG